jgi:hypothetical protein
MNRRVSRVIHEPVEGKVVFVARPPEGAFDVGLTQDAASSLRQRLARLHRYVVESNV